VCNGGWLSQLEQLAKPVIAALLGGTRRLSHINARILSLWAVKTVAVLNWASNYRRLVPAQHFQLLNYLRVPDGAYVDVAFAMHGNGLHWAQTQQSLTFGVADTETLRSVLERSYNIGIAVADLLVRVTYFPLATHATNSLDPDGVRRNSRVWPLRPYVGISRRRRYESVFDQLAAVMYVPVGD